MKLDTSPKTVMAITLIVMLGLLFGVAGYLIVNKSKTILPVMPPSQKEVIITTDKTEYEQGKEVKINIKNNISADIEIYWPYFEVEKKENNQWEKITTDLCSCSNIECNVDINGFEILKKGEARSEKWNQKVADCNGREEIENYYFEASAGIYRIAVKTRITTHNHFSLDYFYSDEFTIKEKIKDETADWKTYRNKEYGFEVKYPSSYLVGNNTPYIVIAEPNLFGKGYSVGVEIYLEGNRVNGFPAIGSPFRDTSKISFKEFAGYAAREQCLVGGTMGRVTCDKVIEQVPFTFTSEIKGYKIYVNEVTTGLERDEWGLITETRVTEGKKGPIFALDVAEKTNNKLRGIFFVPLLFVSDLTKREEGEKATEKNLNQILSTFKFIKEDEESFSCGTSIVKDIDGNEYNTVKIGEQCWLKENLKVTKNPQGKAITRYCYDNDPKICDTDGGLYDWNTAMNNSTEEGAQGICPNGWHIPKDSEWYALESGLATGSCSADRDGWDWDDWGCDSAGTKLKTGGSSGFQGILAGDRNTGGSFRNRGTYAGFWSSTESEAFAWTRSLGSTDTTVYRHPFVEALGFSVRCLKD